MCELRAGGRRLQAPTLGCLLHACEVQRRLPTCSLPGAFAVNVPSTSVVRICSYPQILLLVCTSEVEGKG